jgi:hypothetical protein
MELIKTKQVTYKIHKKPDDMKMSTWTNFWKDKITRLDKIQRYPGSYAGDSPYEILSENMLYKYVDYTEEEFGDEVNLSIEFTSEEALSIADPHYGFMSEILGRVRSKSNLNRDKEIK